MIQLRDYQQRLFEKTKQAFANGYHRPLVVAPCGAGKSYIFAKMAEKTAGEVLVLTHRRELKQQHETLLRNTGILNARVEMVLTEKNHLEEHSPPRLIILDEAHLSRSNSWVKVIEHYKSPCVGFTATPCRLDGKPLGDIYDTLIEDVSVRELIANKRLAPYEYYAPTTVNTDGVRSMAGDFVISELEKIMCEKAIYGDVISAYNLLAMGERTIAYCVSVKHAQAMADEFRAAGITAEAVSNQTPPAKRRNIMQAFREGEITVLCNVGIISEGVSIDEVSCCLLLRPTESHALYWQQAMRCMRYLPGKTAKIIDCVGNYTRNPMPNEDVRWSLTESQKRKARFTEEGNFLVRVCPNCFMTFRTAPICPYCGTKYPLHPKEIQKKKEIELKMITDEEADKIAEAKRKARQQQGRAKSFPELVAIGKERGYKNPSWWAMQVLKGRTRH